MPWSIALVVAFFYTPCTSTKIEAVFDESSSSIVIRGFESSRLIDIQKRVSVYFGETPEIASIPEVIGKFEKVGNDIQFRAKYGFSPGSSYTIIVWADDDPSDRRVIAQQLAINIPSVNKTSSTSIRNVFPTASHLPMNQLKIYIEFSAPMSIGKSSEYVKLYRMPGYEWEKEAFLITHEELWDPDQKRLTIFFDPGRIKRGVQPNLQLGLPLVEGRKYRLVIDKEWPDRNGTPLVQSLIKDFHIIGLDRTSPDPEKWIVQSPAASNSPLTIDFQESLDYGLLHSTIEVVKDNHVVQGNIHLEGEESVWIFTPDHPWTQGDYEIRINPWLEDLAGNNLRRKFDVDLTDPKDKPKDINQVNIPFKIKNQSN